MFKLYGIEGGLNIRHTCFIDIAAKLKEAQILCCKIYFEYTALHWQHFLP